MQETIKEVSKSIKEILEDNIIIGQKIEIEDNIIIPVFKIKLNFTIINANIKTNDTSGNTAQISATPIAFINVKDGKVQVVSLEKETTSDKILTNIPSLLDNLTSILKFQ